MYKFAPRCVQDVGGARTKCYKNAVIHAHDDGRGPKPHTRIVFGNRTEFNRKPRIIFEEFPQQDFGMDVDIKNAFAPRFSSLLLTSGKRRACVDDARMTVSARMIAGMSMMWCDTPKLGFPVPAPPL